MKTNKIEKIIYFFEYGLGNILEHIAIILCFPLVLLIAMAKSNNILIPILQTGRGFIILIFLLVTLILFIFLAVISRTSLKESYYDIIAAKMIENGADVYFHEEKITNKDMINSLLHSSISYSFNENENKIWFE